MTESVHKTEDRINIKCNECLFFGTVSPEKIVLAALLNVFTIVFMYFSS